jgi:hypothetical protein
VALPCAAALELLARGATCHADDVACPVSALLQAMLREAPAAPATPVSPATGMAHETRVPVAA